MPNISNREMVIESLFPNLQIKLRKVHKGQNSGDVVWIQNDIAKLQKWSEINKRKLLQDRV